LRPNDDSETVTHLQRELNNLPEALARILVIRGIETFEAARHFFRPTLEDLHDPLLMRDMEAAAARVVHAFHENERIIVYGDYDVDGTTSTTLMTHFLLEQGADAQYFIPDRKKDGYGLGKNGIDYAADVGARLIIALDCGITAVKEAEYIRERGMDLIICDHHTPKEILPDAVAVLDPKRADCSYPFKELCGCGVTFKLVQAIMKRQMRPPEDALPFLDLVAVATASDIVPIFGENRVLMAEGLKRLGTAPRLGFRALAHVAGIDLANATTSRIVFGLGPRINAAGRLGDAGRAVELLIAADEDKAAKMAAELEAVNEKRRVLDHETVREAIQMAERQLAAHSRSALVLHHPKWHLGVIGIVASRIVERFYRPAVMLGNAGNQIKGSARSIHGVNIFNALTACSDLLTEFGGHDYAAGMSLLETNLPAFRDRLDEAVRAVMTPELMLPSINIDAHLDLDVIDRRFWAVLKQFAPFGPKNSTPIFHAGNLGVVGTPRTIGRDGTHLKFKVSHRTGNGAQVMEAIGFGMRELLPVLETSQRQEVPFEMLFSVEENVWKGRSTLQLRARDMRLEKNASEA